MILTLLIVVWVVGFGWWFGEYVACQAAAKEKLEWLTLVIILLWPVTIVFSWIMHKLGVRE